MRFIEAAPFILPLLLASACSTQPEPVTKPPRTSQQTQSIGGCEVTNLMPIFWTFWDAARDMPPAEQLALFNKIVRTLNGDVYSAIFQSVNNAGVDADGILSASFARSKSVDKAMRDISQTLAQTLPDHLARFRHAFPDFACSTPVVIVYSGGAFDGALRTVNGRSTLLFGVDVMAFIDNPPTVLMAHELFHVHHQNIVQTKEPRFFWHMWREGLATYVGRQLNMDLDEQRGCCMPSMAPAERVAAALLIESLPVLDSENRIDHARYFFGGQPTALAPRAGYYLGYVVARELGKTRSLQSLARMTPEEVRPLLETTLRKMLRDGIEPIGRY